jgi:hypothetical protein
MPTLAMETLTQGVELVEQWPMSPPSVSSRLSTARRELGAHALDHDGVVDGLGDIAVLRRLVGYAEGVRSSVCGAARSS